MRDECVGDAEHGGRWGFIYTFLRGYCFVQDLREIVVRQRYPGIVSPAVPQTSEITCAEFLEYQGV